MQDKDIKKQVDELMDSAQPQDQAQGRPSIKEMGAPKDAPIVSQTIIGSGFQIAGDYNGEITFNTEPVRRISLTNLTQQTFKKFCNIIMGRHIP